MAFVASPQDTQGSSYTGGQCTWWVAGNTPWVRAMPALGNAADWLTNAVMHGAIRSNIAKPGAVAVWAPNTGGADGYGHVALVVGVSGNKVTVSEMNWTYGAGKADTRTTDASNIAGFLYAPGSDPASLASSNLAGNQVNGPTPQAAASGGILSLIPGASGILGNLAGGVATAGPGGGFTNPIDTLTTAIAAGFQTIVKGGEVLIGAALVMFGAWLLTHAESSIPSPLKAASKVKAVF